MAAQNFLLHIHISTDIVRKMTLSSRPPSVDELKTMIKEKFKLDFDFSLSYQDPDFDGQLCSLLDIEELAQKVVLKVIRSETDASSVASDGTIILPHAITPDRTERWPDVFPVPTFSYEVELILGEGNVAYERTGKTLKLSRGQKHDILETLAAKMHSFKAYPNDKDVSMVTEALVTQDPCLTEPGSRTGWYGWKNSLKFKMGNYRTKLSRAGFHEVAVNSGKRSRNNPDKHASHTNIKRPKRAEVNFLPNFPRGEDPASLEQLRLQIVDQVQMNDRNLPLITKLMQTTFALRRKEVIGDELPVCEILDRWPTLKMESQICAEFHRITNMNLKNHFYAVLDQHAPRLQSLFRKKAARTGRVAEVLDQLFRNYDLQEQVDVHVRRAAVLRALPAYLHEDDSRFLKLWDVAQSDEPDIDDITVGLLLINTSSTDAKFFCPERIAVVLEGNVVIDCTTLADGFVMLFGLIYGLHLSYPKDLANTFDFIQKVLMGLDDGKLRPRVLSLKNDLLAVE
ncbi:sterile alpha motif domain-containing protein 3-like isoform X2 [Paramormyrops kingsleyae]